MAAGCDKVFRKVASGAKTDRDQLRRALARLEAGDVLMVTRRDRLALNPRPPEHARHSYRSFVEGGFRPGDRNRHRAELRRKGLRPEVDA